MGGPANTGGGAMGLPNPMGSTPNSWRGSGTALDPGRLNGEFGQWGITPWAVLTRPGGGFGGLPTRTGRPVNMQPAVRTINGQPVVRPAVPAPPGQPAPDTTALPPPVATAPVAPAPVGQAIPTVQPRLGGLYGTGATTSRISAGDPRGRGARRVG